MIKSNNNAAGDIRIHYLETRLNYHAVALAENEILPMPWELEELEEIQKQVKHLLQQKQMFYQNQINI